MARRLITGILLCFCAVLLMSYNTFALDLSEEVRFLNEYVNPYWNDSHNQGWTNGSRSYSTNGNYNGTDYVQVRSQNNTNISASVGEYYSFTFTVIATGLSSGQANKSGFFGVSTASTDCNILELHDIEVEATPLSGNNEQRTVRYTVGGFCRVTNAISQGPNINVYIKSTNSSTSLATSIQFHNLTKWSADTSITTLNNTVNSAITSLNNIYSVLNDILNQVNNIANNQHDVNQEQTDATNNSEQQTNTESNTSESDVNQSTQSLLTAGASIIGALTSAPATDCKINVSTTGSSAAFTSAIGNLNLCSDVPSGVLTLVQGMVALVFTPIVLYYVYSILTLIYAQFKEYND